MSVGSLVKPFIILLRTAFKSNYESGHFRSANIELQDGRCTVASAAIRRAFFNITATSKTSAADRKQPSECRLPVRCIDFSYASLISENNEAISSSKWEFFGSFFVRAPLRREDILLRISTISV
jgi:hypothetical protein